MKCNYIYDISSHLHTILITSQPSMDINRFIEPYESYFTNFHYIPATILNDWYGSIYHILPSLQDNWFSCRIVYNLHHTNINYLSNSFQWYAAIKCWLYYGDVIMGAIASQIISLTIVYSPVYSDADEIKHQNSASLAFVPGEFPAQMASNAENVSIWWRHHVHILIQTKSVAFIGL